MAAIDLQQSRARLDVRRGAFDDADDRLARARRLMVKTIDPPYQAPLSEIAAELALWRGRPDDARDAVVTGLLQLQDVDDPWFAAPLLWLGLRAQADAAADATAHGDREADARARQAGADLLARARSLLDGLEFVAIVTHAYVCLCEAEADRLTRTDARQSWERAVAAWESIGHPFSESYARWRLRRSTARSPALARWRRVSGAGARGRGADRCRSACPRDRDARATGKDRAAELGVDCAGRRRGVSDSRDRERTYRAAASKCWR